MTELEEKNTTIDSPNYFKNEKFEISLIETDILVVQYFENNLIELADIKLAVEKGLKISPSNDTKLLVHMEKFVEVDKESREFLQNDYRILRAEAHVIPHLAYKIMFNLFYKLRKKNRPLRAFDKLQSAINWLNNV